MSDAGRGHIFGVPGGLRFVKETAICSATVHNVGNAVTGTEVTSTRYFGSERWFLLMFAFALLVVCACALTSWKYPRGTDQYWYIADAESLAHGIHTTNNVYPANVTGPLPASFIHNNVAIYAAVPLASVLGGQRGWIATNLICTIGSALIVFLLLRSRSVRVAALIATLFLLLPLTVWLTCNTLTEAVYAFFASLCLVVWLRAKTLLGTLFFVLSALIAASAKEPLMLLFLVPVLPSLFGMWQKGPALRWTNIALSVFGFAAYSIFRPIIFPENIHYTLAARLITGATAAKDSMAPFFMNSTPVFQWTILWEKVGRNLRDLLRFRTEEMPFIVPLYLLVVLFLWQLGRNRKQLWVDCKESRAGLFTIVLVSSYFITAVLVLNAIRYSQYVIAPLLISTSLFVKWTERKLQVIGFCIACLLPIALVLVLRIRKDSRQEFTETKMIAQFVNSHLESGDPLLVLRVPAGQYLQTGYAVRPRPALMIEEENFCEVVNLYRSRYNVRYVFGPSSFLMGRGKLIGDLDRSAGYFADYGLYDIQTTCR